MPEIDASAYGWRAEYERVKRLAALESHAQYVAGRQGGKQSGPSPRAVWEDELKMWREEQEDSEQIRLLKEILAKLTPQVLTAPGGLCAPTRAFYDSFPKMSAERGAIAYGRLTEDEAGLRWSGKLAKKKKKKGKKRK